MQKYEWYEDSFRGPITYRVKATGFGCNLASYNLDFTILSNYDIETHPEDVMRKVRNELKKTWQTGYRINSVKKEA